MKSIKEFINEAKFNFSKDIISEEDIDKIKLQKKFEYKGDLKTKHFIEESLREYFGKLTQWLTKNVPNIAKQVEKQNLDFPDALDMEFPSGLKGELRLDWDVYWRDGKAIGKLRSVEIEVGRFCPSDLSNMRYYDAKHELESYRLPEPIKF